MKEYWQDGNRTGLKTIFPAESILTFQAPWPASHLTYESKNKVSLHTMNEEKAVPLGSVHSVFLKTEASWSSF